MATTPKSSVKDLPVNVDFDLDSYEKPESERIPDFVTRIGGKTIAFTNPDEIDWKDLLEITDPVHFLRHSVSEEDRIHILSQKIPGHKFNELMERYQSHFRIQEKIARARQAERFNGV